MSRKNSTLETIVDETPVVLTDDVQDNTEETIVENETIATETDVEETSTDTETPATPEAPKPLSAYRQRMQDLGLEGLTAEVPVEMADMIRAAAKKQGDVALTAWMRLTFADAVNAAELTHEVDGVQVAWTFDKARLEEKKARQSTKGLTEEEKKAKADEKKQAEKDQRALVKQLLAEHKQKLAGTPVTPEASPVASSRIIPTPPNMVATTSGIIIARR